MPRINTEYHEDAKKKIIAAALAIASDKGWDAVTLENISRRVGVTKGALYSYFDNSEALEQDIILMMIRLIRDNFVQCLSSEENIQAALERTAEFIFLHPKPFVPVFIQAIANIPKDSGFLEDVSRLFDENSSLFIDALERFRKKGQIPEDVDMAAAVRAIYAMTMGLGLMTHLLKKDPEITKKVWIESAGRILLLGKG